MGKEDNEIKAKKPIPAWVFITGALEVLAVLFIIFMVFTSSSPEKKVAKKLAGADRYMTELKYEEAVALYNEVLQIDPKNLEAYEGAFKAYTELGKYDEAQSILDKLQDMYDDLSDSEKEGGFGKKLKKLIDKLSEGQGADGAASAGAHGLCTKATLYDLNGNVSGNYSYEYDSESRLVKRTEYLFDSDTALNIVTFEYTDDGVLKKAEKRSTADEAEVTTLELTSADGDTFSYSYAQKSNGPTPLIEGTVTYDAGGNGKGEVRHYDENMQLMVTQKIECDSTGRITKIQSTFAGSPEEGLEEHVFNAAGTLTEIKYHSATDDGVQSLEFSFADGGSRTEIDKWNGNIREEYVFYPDGNLQVKNNYSDGAIDTYETYEYSDNGNTVVIRASYGDEGDYEKRHFDRNTGVFTTESYMDGALVYNYDYEIDPSALDTEFSFDERERAPFKAFFGDEMVNYNECTNHVTCFDDYMPYTLTSEGYFFTYRPVWNEFEADASGNIVKWHKYSLDKKDHIWAVYEYQK